MANVTGSLLWKIDTTGTITTDRVRLAAMRWQPAAISDTLEVTDENSKVIWSQTAAGATPLGDVFWEVPPGHPGFFNGIIVTISAGELYVTLGG
jgi:hypothetical protein